MATIPTNQVHTPFLGLIPGGFNPGFMIRVKGTMRHVGERFDINLQCGPALHPQDDVALHISVRPQEFAIVRNHYEKWHWGEEERGGGCSIRRGHPYEILILAEATGYKLAIDGRHFGDFRHRIPLSKVRFIHIGGDTDVSMIGFENDREQACLPPEYRHFEQPIQQQPIQHQPIQQQPPPCCPGQQPPMTSIFPSAPPPSAPPAFQTPVTGIVAAPYPQGPSQVQPIYPILPQPPPPQLKPPIATTMPMPMPMPNSALSYPPPPPPQQAPPPYAPPYSSPYNPAYNQNPAQPNPYPPPYTPSPYPTQEPAIKIEGQTYSSSPAYGSQQYYPTNTAYIPEKKKKNTALKVAAVAGGIGLGAYALSRAFHRSSSSDSD